MPIYEYKCTECEETLEVLHKMSDEPPESCSSCGGHLKRVLHPVGLIFKGKGFYSTDNRGERSGGSSEKKVEQQGSETAKKDACSGCDKTCAAGD